MGRAGDWTRRAPKNAYFFFAVDLFFEGLRGTFAPALRACESPIAIACLRLLTFLPDLPLFSVPRLRSCIAFLTLLFDLLPYLAAISLSFAQLSDMLSSCHPLDDGVVIRLGWSRHRIRFFLLAHRLLLSVVCVGRLSQTRLQQAF